MTDSTDSVNNNEVTEDIKKLAVSDATTQDVLKAIGSQSEPTKRSSSKLSNHQTIEAFNTKLSKHSTGSHSIVADETVNNPLQDNEEGDVKGRNTLDSTECHGPPSNPVTAVQATNENPAPCTQGLIADVASVVPDCMYSVLQQKAQNVLKMISPESDPKPPEIQSSKTDQKEESSHQSVLEKSNDSANFKNSKTSYQSSSNLSEMKSSSKSTEHSLNEKVSSPSKQAVPKNLSYTTVQHNIVSQSLQDNTIALPDSKKLSVPISDSQQSNRSTEQCTTDYCIKSLSESVPSTNSKNEVLGSDDTIKKVSARILSQQCCTMENTVPAVTENVNEKLAVITHTANDMIKDLSHTINSNDAPVKLTTKGELISQLFKQKFLTKLEANGSLNENSAEVAKLTAIKFAKWMEDILKEIDTRKKNLLKENKKSNELKQIKEEKEREEELTSPASSKESLSNKEELSQKDHEESPEIVKIQELSDSELIEKYSTHLRESKCELFQFTGPDNVPVEVQHLTNVESKKVMIVKKKTSDTQWSNWVIEVGPDVTLESVSVSGSVSQSENNEDEVMMKGSDAGIWNLRKLTWENWKPDIFKQSVLQHKVPKLKKQCMMTAADFGIEYPSYPFISTPFE